MELVSARAKQRVQGQSCLLGGQIPNRDLNCLVKWKRMRALIAATRAIDAVGYSQRRLTLEVRPDLGLENPHDLCKRRQVLEQDLHEAKTAIASIIDKFDRSDIDHVGADLTVANHPVPGELETGQFK